MKVESLFLLFLGAFFGAIGLVTGSGATRTAAA